MFGRNAAESKPLRRAFGQDVTNTNRQNFNGKNAGKVEKRNAVIVIEQRAQSRARTNQEDANMRDVDILDNRDDIEVVPVRHQSIRSGTELTAEQKQRLDDIDERDSDDILCVTSYVNDMFEHYFQKEPMTSPNPEYMKQQGFINARMREILVDWLVDVHYKYKMVPDTLYLTINTIDRFLERKEIERSRLQLLGVTALSLASKYEEIYPPTISDLVRICDNAYTETQIVDMEFEILGKLNYNITVPTSHTFLVRFLKAGHANRKIVHYSIYLLDSTLQCHDLLQFLPSQLAAAVIMIARTKENRYPWSPTLQKYTNYTEDEVAVVAEAILAARSVDKSNVDAVERKYSRDRFGRVAGTHFSL